MSAKSAFLLASPWTGCGKSTIAAGIARSLSNTKSGHYHLRVIPFKCGPDLYDPTLLTQAARNKALNLDPFLQGKSLLISSFHDALDRNDVALVEGMMGLFDGHYYDAGSCAEIARLLRIPVILILDAERLGFSAAPLIQGFVQFDPTVHIGGVIFNRTSGPAHQQHLLVAALRARVDPIGFIPFSTNLTIQQDCLGIISDPNLPNDTNQASLQNEQAQPSTKIDAIAQFVEKHIDLDRLLKITTYQNSSWQQTPKIKTHPQQPSVHPTIKNSEKAPVPTTPTEPKFAEPTDLLPRILILNGPAFPLFYANSLQVLEKKYLCHFIDPLDGSTIPPQTKLLIIPDGPLDLYIEPLKASNFWNSLQTYLKANRRAIAFGIGSCTLGRHIIDRNGIKHEMTGIFDYTARSNVGFTIGYRQINMPNGITLYGNEYRTFNLTPNSNVTPAPCQILNARNEPAEGAIYFNGRQWASPIHIFLRDDLLIKLILEDESHPTC